MMSFETAGEQLKMAQPLTDGARAATHAARKAAAPSGRLRGHAERLDARGRMRAGAGTIAWELRQPTMISKLKSVVRRGAASPGGAPSASAARRRRGPIIRCGSI